MVIPIRLQDGKLNLELENVSNRCGPGNVGRIFKEGNNPSLVIHYAGALPQLGDEINNGSCAYPPSKQLVVPLQLRVLQGLCLVQAHLLSMEIPTEINITL